MKFIDSSGKSFNTIHGNDMSFYEEVHTVIHAETSAAFSPEILGLLAAIGIGKEEPFAPDGRMKEILSDAVAVGNATARAISMRGPCSTTGTPWSFVNYDPQTRSLLQTASTPFPSVSSQSGTVQTNGDGSITVWFGPEPPAGGTPTGCRLFPVKAGSRSCACTVPWIRGSRRPGVQVSWCP